MFIQLTAGRKWGTAFYSDGCGSRRERTVAPKEESRAQARDGVASFATKLTTRSFYIYKKKVANSVIPRSVTSNSFQSYWRVRADTVLK